MCNCNGFDWQEPVGDVMKPGEKLDPKTNAAPASTPVPPAPAKATPTTGKSDSKPKKSKRGGASYFDSGTGAQKALYMGIFGVDQSVR